MNKKPSVLSILSSSTLQSNVIIPTIRERYDYLAKVILIGASGSGKTCLLRKFLDFDSQMGPTKQTIGVEFQSKIVELPSAGLAFKLQIWDTAGQERFRSITSSYYRGSAGVVICVDLTRLGGLAQVEADLADVKNLAHNDQVSCLIVGTKADLQDRVVYSVQELVEFAQEMRAKFALEVAVVHGCSSVTGDNVYEVFESLTVAIADKIERGQIDVLNCRHGVQLGTNDQIVHSDSNMNLELAGRPYRDSWSCCL